MSWTVPTASAPARLPPNSRRNARSRWAPPGANGTMIVSSETLPSRLPTRPALCTGGGAAWDASDASLLSTFSSAVLPTSGASANSSRSWLIFSSTDSVAVGASVVMSALPFVSFAFQAKLSTSSAQNAQWCAAAKSVSTFGCGGTSDSTFAPALNGGQGTGCDTGLPVAAKFAQAVRILAASACWSELRTAGYGALG